MSAGEQASSEPLRDLWLSARGMSDREVRLVTTLVRQEERTVRSELRRRRTWLIGVYLMLALLTGLQARHPESSWSGAALTSSAVASLVAAAGLALGLRRWRPPEAGLPTREYYDRLLALYDQQIRFERTLGLWVAMPLLAMIGSLGVTVAVNARSTVAGLAAAAIWAVFTCLIIRRDSAAAIGRLREQRRHVTEWLADVGALEGGADGASSRR